MKIRVSYGLIGPNQHNQKKIKPLEHRHTRVQFFKWPNKAPSKDSEQTPTFSEISTTKTEDKVEGRLLLDIVVRKGATILQLLPGKDETLLVRWDAFLVLNLCLHVVDGVGALHLQRDRLPSQGLDEDLHPTTQPEHQVQGRLLLDIVIREGPPVLELLPGKDEPLLVRRDPLLVLNLRLHVVDRIRALDLEGDRLPSKGLDEDLHPTTEPEHQMERRLLLDVVVGEGSAVLELLPGEDEPLLVRRDPLLVLDLGLHVVDRVRALHLERDRLPG
ncbi:hypothetical protein TorRG33x02_024050 [Trema orientale]|uniref:Uncharacterized protein n=1 Tax=Trema orientale TaxID=63057 RepID=A0A2P5FV14_TREOI|nr:hypothetical protein TorRG33x02_024050 [Trema orientale]